MALGKRPHLRDCGRKIDTIPLHGLERKPAWETPTERMVNIVFSVALVATVVGLWIYFR